MSDGVVFPEIDEIAALGDLDGAGAGDLEVDIFDALEGGGAHEGLDVPVCFAALVGEAGGVGFADGAAGPLDVAGGVVGEPVDGEGADGGVLLPLFQVVDQGGGGGAAHFDELVRVHEAEPDVLGGVAFDAVGVGVYLEGFAVFDVFGADVVEVDRGGGDAVGGDEGVFGELGLGAVVVDVEFADAVVVVMVDEEFGHIDRLVFDQEAQCEVLRLVSRR